MAEAIDLAEVPEAGKTREYSDTFRAARETDTMLPQDSVGLGLRERFGLAIDTVLSRITGYRPALEEKYAHEIAEADSTTQSLHNSYRYSDARGTLFKAGNEFRAVEKKLKPYALSQGGLTVVIGLAAFAFSVPLLIKTGLITAGTFVGVSLAPWLATALALGIVVTPLLLKIRKVIHTYLDGIDASRNAKKLEDHADKEGRDVRTLVFHNWDVGTVLRGN